MCGIAGFFSYDPLPAGLIGKMTEFMRHRGPDDEGFVLFRDLMAPPIVAGSFDTAEQSWRTEIPYAPEKQIEQVADMPVQIALGHRRLSIIDLSPFGHQPMMSRDGRYWLVFNGEIYNYRELRLELQIKGHHFISDSDTEVLLAAWSVWGTSCLPRLVGMFAFAIYDRVANTLTCVRDAFGIKPLFYAHDGDKFLFASELPAMLQLRAGHDKLNWQRAYDYLIYGVQDQGFGTFVKGIYHVPPAHLVRLNLDDPTTLDIERWWRPDIAQKTNLSLGDAAEALRGLFLESVRLHLRSDVLLGAALSGGIDSSALVCAMRYLDPDMPIHTFSFIASNGNLSEEMWVDTVNAHVGAQVHKVLLMSDDLGRDLPDLIQTQGEPFCTTSMYAQYRVFQEALNHGITVVLEGQGADELLAGYQGYPGQRMRSLLECGDIAGMYRFATNWKQWPGREGQSAWRALVGQLLPDGLYSNTLHFVGKDTCPAYMDINELKKNGVSTHPNRLPRSSDGRGRRVAEALSRAVTVGGLSSLLRYGDRNAMRFSIENRVPFLTLQIAEFLFSLPEDYLISETGQTKHVFREAMRGIVPDTILNRKDKIGFETPMQEWLHAMVPPIQECLAQTTQFPFLDSEKMVSKFKLELEGKKSISLQMWRPINLSWWARLFSVH